MLNRAAPNVHLDDDLISRSPSPLDDALLRAARTSELWYDAERERPCMLVDGAPVPLPRPRKDGACPASSHHSVRAALDDFKRAVITALTPSLGGAPSRRMRHYAALLARQGGHAEADGLATVLRTATESGACELAWRLAEIPDACQRPSASHLEQAFSAWLAEQVPDASGALVVLERQARVDLERIAGEEVPLRLLRWLAIWNRFRRVHARRARLLIRP